MDGVKRSRTKLSTLFLAVALLVAPDAVADKTYTLDGDFDQGILDSVNHDSPNNHQLQLDVVSSTEPFIWIANWAVGTVTKIDTRTGDQVAKYDSVLLQNDDGTSPNVRPPREPNNSCRNSPSRTAVDGDGNAFVANRAFCSYPSVTKFSGTLSNCVDRNANGVIDTSHDANGNGLIDLSDPAEYKGQADECILWTKNYAGSRDYGRSLAVDADQNVWAGGFVTSKLYKLDGQTGALLDTIDPDAETNDNSRTYGIAIGPGGYIYTSDISFRTIRKIDPSASNGNHVVSTVTSPVSTYGIAVDSNGIVWLGNWSGNGGIVRVDFDAGTATRVGTEAGGCPSLTRGVAVDGDNNIWAACWSHSKLIKHNNAGTALFSVSVGAGPIGVAVDGDQNIWTANYSNNSATRYNPSTGDVDTFTVSGQPYSYSDMTGFQQRNFTSRRGDWTAVHDSGAADTPWGTVTWNQEAQGSEPSGTTIKVEVRAANAAADLALQPYTEVQNGVPFASIDGRLIEVRATLAIQEGDVSPVLSDLTIKPANAPPVAICEAVTTCADQTCTANASIDGGSYDPDGDELAMSQLPPGPYSLGVTPVTLSVSDGRESDVCTAPVTVNDCTPPSITCPPATVAECTENGSAVVDPGDATAADDCSAVTVTDPGADTYALGTTNVGYTATDSYGNAASCSTTVTVVDTTPPDVLVNSPQSLWPPNHKYHTVSLEDCGVVVRDQCVGDIALANAGAKITCVTSDEPENTTGDGNTSNDIVLVDDTTVKLRAERRGPRDGRVYKIHFTVQDPAGNVTQGVCPVVVAHDQSGRAAVDNDVAYSVCR